MILTFIYNLSVYILLLPIIIGAAKYSRLIGVQKMLFWMITIIALNQFISEVWVVTVEENNMPFFYFYILIEMLFILKIFWLLFFGKRKELILSILLGVFLIIWLIIILVPGMIWKYPDELRSVESIGIISLSILYFVKVFREQKIVDLKQNFSFWFGASLLLYFMCNLVLYLFSQVFLELTTTENEYIWLMHAFLTMFLYIMYTLGLLCKEKEII